MIRSKKLTKFKEISHAFFNRSGGKSAGIYRGLNCGLGSSDKKKNILKNLEIVRRKIGPNSRKIILLNQTHSAKFNYLDKKIRLNNNKFFGDALITNRINTPIGVLTADCVPILIYDKEMKMAAAIHAGWKGAYKNIVKKVLKFMIKKGCRPINITAAIGPCISLKNYEIKQDFIKKFITKDRNNRIFFKKVGNKNFFNLKKYIHFQLKSSDIKKIDIINKDTFDVKNNFFSARRSIRRNDNDYGRNISIIVIN